MVGAAAKWDTPIPSQSVGSSPTCSTLDPASHSRPQWETASDGTSAQARASRWGGSGWVLSLLALAWPGIWGADGPSLSLAVTLPCELLTIND